MTIKDTLNGLVSAYNTYEFFRKTPELQACTTFIDGIQIYKGLEDAAKAVNADIYIAEEWEDGTVIKAFDYAEIRFYQIYRGVDKNE